MTPSRGATLKLGAFLYTAGHHIAAWRHPDSQVDATVNVDHYVRLAQTAERGKFDLVFLADSSGVRGIHDLESASRISSRSIGIEPLTLLAVISASTRHVGLIATATTTYNEPFHLARRYASLDLVSGGRAGWNLVTSNNESEAFNFGHDKHPAHADRYRRAREFTAVVTGLWDSWEDDAFIRDRVAGQYFDPDRLHVLDHEGEAFSVRGPLNVARPPQGHPVLVQAGASEAGRALAGDLAEVVFTAQPELEGAQAFYADIKRRAVAAGRSADDVKVMPGFSPVIGESAAHAQEKLAELDALVDPVVGVSLLSAMLGGFDLRVYPVDGPLPDMPETNGPRSRQKLLVDAARRDNLTIRDLYRQVAGARGHCAVAGTPSQIADVMETWFTQGAADGFNIMPPILPTGLTEFVDKVVPELQRRGLVRTKYEGRTLRDNLGLRRPAHPKAAR